MSGGGQGNTGWTNPPREILQQAAFALAFETLKALATINGIGATAAVALIASQALGVDKRPIALGAALFCVGLVTAVIAMGQAFFAQEAIAAKGTMAGNRESRARDTSIRLAIISLVTFVLAVIACALPALF